MMCRLLALIAAVAIPATAALAQSGTGPNITVSGAYLGPVVPGTTTTRPANTTAYGANTIVCGSTCAAFTVNIAQGPSGPGVQKGRISRVGLLKSSSNTANASFTIWFYDAAPTIPVAGDQSAYVGPYAADMPHYLGSASCATPNATNDATAQEWYECSIQNAALMEATIKAQAALGASFIYGVISAAAAYTPGSGETFVPYVTGYY